jgi:hypothetical protein
MGTDVEVSLDVLRNARSRSEDATRDNLSQYVANRTKAYEAFARLDPDSQMTRDAKQRLDEAQRSQDELEASLCSDGD